MATCKDCIHYDICIFHLNGDEANKCRHFVNTADVVPKSEVEKWKEINEQLHKEMSERMIAECKIERKLVAMEIFAEIEEYAELQIESLNIAEKLDLSGSDFFGGGKQAFVLLLDRLAELKKKYKEGKT